MIIKKNESKVAAIQMSSSNIVEENLLTAEKFITEAAQNGVKLVALPEMFPIMGINPTDKVSVKETFKHGITQDFLSKQAKLHQIWIVSGTIPIACKNEAKIRAASIVYDEKGKVVARYDKIHLFDVTLSETESYKESDTTEPGHEIVLVDTPVGKLGLTVCYDLRFPELFRSLTNQGAEIITVPSAFTEETGAAHWELLTRCRAVENFCYIIGSCQGGTHANARKTYGHSMIIDPWGKILSKMEGTKPGIIYSEIDLDRLKEVRKSIPVAAHQRIFFDLSNL